MGLAVEMVSAVPTAHCHWRRLGVPAESPAQPALAARRAARSQLVALKTFAVQVLGSVWPVRPELMVKLIYSYFLLHCFYTWFVPRTATPDQSA